MVEQTDLLLEEHVVQPIADVDDVRRERGADRSTRGLEKFGSPWEGREGGAHLRFGRGPKRSKAVDCILEGGLQGDGVRGRWVRQLGTPVDVLVRTVQGPDRFAPLGAAECRQGRKVRSVTVALERTRVGTWGGTNTAPGGAGGGSGGDGGPVLAGPPAVLQPWGWCST